MNRTEFFEIIKKPLENETHYSKATSYYLEQYDRFYPKKWFLSWNWASFLSVLLGYELLWLVYRRMYSNAIIYFFILKFLNQILFNAFISKLEISKIQKMDLLNLYLNDFNPKQISLYLIIMGIKSIVAFSMAVGSNALYLQYCEKKALKLQNNPRKRIKSGVDKVTPAIMAVIIVGLMSYLFRYQPQLSENTNSLDPDLLQHEQFNSSH